MELTIFLQPGLNNIVGKAICWKSDKIVGEVIEYNSETGWAKLEIKDDDYKQRIVGKVNGANLLMMNDDLNDLEDD